MHIHISTDGLKKYVKLAFSKRTTTILIKEIESLLELVRLLFIEPGLLRGINVCFVSAQPALRTGHIVTFVY